MVLITDHDLAQARAAHESIMTATGTVRSPGEGWVFNPDTGQSEPAPGEVIYQGKLRVQRVNLATTAIAAGQNLTVGTHVGAVPWHVTDLAPGCTVTVTDSTDPQILAARLVVTDVEQSTFVTARRFWATEAKNQPA